MTALQLATPPSEEQVETRSPVQRRRFPWWLLVITVLAATAWLVHGLRKVDPLAGLELALVRRTDIEDTVTALGKIQPREYVDVGAQVSGQVQKLEVRAGDLVDAGALLAEIDPRLQVAKLEIDHAQTAQLEAERAAQKLQAELTSALFARQQRMKGEGATREDAFERARSEMRVAAAKLEAVDAQIRQIRSTTKADEAQLGYTRIFAPMAGTVVSLDARVGQTLAATTQVPVLMRIADLSSMTVWAQVSEADVTRLLPGMELYFTTLGHPGRRWRSALSRILPAPPKPATQAGAPAVVNSVVLYTALFDVDNAAGELRPEMSAQVFFVAARAANALVIPRLALHDASEDGAKASVRVVDEAGRLSTRNLKLGIRNRFDVQVLDGVREGERVVTGEGEAP